VLWSIPAVGAIILGIVCFILGKKFENPDNVDYTKAVFVRKETVKPVRGPRREVLIYEYTVGERTYTKKLDPAYNKVPYELETVKILYLKSFPRIAYFSSVGDNLQIAKNLKGGLLGFCIFAAVILGLELMILFL
jgi:hypothetical protein